MQSLTDKIQERIHELSMYSRRPKYAFSDRSQVMGALIELADVIEEWESEIKSQMNCSLVVEENSSDPN